MSGRSEVNLSLALIFIFHPITSRRVAYDLFRDLRFSPFAILCQKPRRNADSLMSVTNLSISNLLTTSTTSKYSLTSGLSCHIRDYRERAGMRLIERFLALKDLWKSGIAGSIACVFSWETEISADVTLDFDSWSMVNFCVAGKRRKTRITIYLR